MNERLHQPIDVHDLTQDQPFLLIGNPDNRRTQGLQEARHRLGLKPAVVLPYAQLLQNWRQGRTIADTVDSNLPVPLIRIDAPGEEWEVERDLLFLGAVNDTSPTTLTGEMGAEEFSAEQALALEQEWGRIYAPAQWFRGWKACLDLIGRESREIWPEVRFMNEPGDIQLMFDKRACQQHLSSHGVDVPPALQSSQPIRNYMDVRSSMKAAEMHRVFVKLACGSGASGVVAYQVNPRTGDEIAVTTMGMEQRQGKTIFFNEGRLRKYTRSEEIATLMNWLCAEGARIERWMPKATLDQRAYDIRQLVAGGQAGHAIMRLSRTPITNLHLRNERMLPAEAGLDEQRMSLVRTAAQAAMSAFPNSWSAGIDVMLTSGSNPRAYVLDVNPFGDLLYRVEHHGLGTYEWEMELLRKEPIQHD
ncbi:STM4014 family protein [Paenibacillus xylanexedens]|uniref:STM4014 family protein n=1 Tax=Paenibacillus xylanexedens TaxID=528191 RepID=UPI001F3B0B09|nr:STM4014 family protein [Paenibacillus xylanexedens]MCF7757591.1 STM4014 family protein [Paenibacillus xylanexedens]